MKTERIELAIVFILSFVVRAIIFYPHYVPTGDAAQFATFVKEISLNGGKIPAVNSLYFPGSMYVYPPLLFLLVSYANVPISFFHHPDGYFIMYELMIIAILASSITSTFVYRMSRIHGNVLFSLTPAMIMIFFTPDIYAISWGGYTYILGEMLMVLFLYSINKKEGERNNWIFYSSIILILQAYTHDLSWFFTMFAFSVIILFDLIKRNFNYVKKQLIAYAIGAVAGLIWWIPRIGFVLNTLKVSQEQGGGILANVVVPLTYIHPFIPFAIAILVILILEAWTFFGKNSQLRNDAFSLTLLASLVFLVFLPNDPTLAARILYYAMILITIIVLRNFSTLVKHLRSIPRLMSPRIRKAVTITFISAIILGAPLQILISTNSVNFYSTGGYQYDQELLNWGEQNFGNSTVIAPHIGNYISAVDGSPVIIYGDFLVGDYQIAQMNAATEMILNSTSSGSLANISHYNVGYIVVPTGLLDKTVYGQKIDFPNAYYVVVFSDQYYTVEKYVGK